MKLSKLISSMMFSIMLLIIMQGCEVENNKSKTSTVKFNGKIAKVKNSSELTQALQSDADKIILKTVIIMEILRLLNQLLLKEIARPKSEQLPLKLLV